MKFLSSVFLINVLAIFGARQGAGKSMTTEQNSMTTQGQNTREDTSQTIRIKDGNSKCLVCDQKDKLCGAQELNIGECSDFERTSDGFFKVKGTDQCLDRYTAGWGLWKCKPMPDNHRFESYIKEENIVTVEQVMCQGGGFVPGDGISSSANKHEDKEVGKGTWAQHSPEQCAQWVVTNEPTASGATYWARWKYGGPNANWCWAEFDWQGHDDRYQWKTCGFVPRGPRKDPTTAKFVKTW